MNIITTYLLFLAFYRAFCKTNRSVTDSTYAQETTQDFENKTTEYFTIVDQRSGGGTGSESSEESEETLIEETRGRYENETTSTGTNPSTSCICSEVPCNGCDGLHWWLVYDCIAEICDCSMMSTTPNQTNECVCSPTNCRKYCDPISCTFDGGRDVLNNSTSYDDGVTRELFSNVTSTGGNNSSVTVGGGNNSGGGVGDSYSSGNFSGSNVSSSPMEFLHGSPRHRSTTFEPNSSQAQDEIESWPMKTDSVTSMTEHNIYQLTDEPEQNSRKPNEKDPDEFTTSVIILLVLTGALVLAFVMGCICAVAGLLSKPNNKISPE